MSSQTVTVDVNLPQQIVFDVTDNQVTIDMPPQEVLQVEAQVSVVPPDQIIILETIRDDSEAARDRAIDAEISSDKSAIAAAASESQSADYRDESKDLHDKTTLLHDQTDDLHNKTEQLHDLTSNLHDKTSDLNDQASDNADRGEVARAGSEAARDRAINAEQIALDSAKRADDSADDSENSATAAAKSEDMADQHRLTAGQHKDKVVDLHDQVIGLHSETQVLHDQSEVYRDEAEDSAAESENHANLSVSASEASEASADKSLVSETASAGSASESEQSRQASDASAGAAKTSETNSKTSETASASSAADSSKSASDSSSSAGESQAQAEKSATSAAASLASERASADSQDQAKLSQDASKTSETASAKSASAAKISETASAESETASAASQAASKTSETASAGSATAAKGSQDAAKASETASSGSATASASSASESAGSADNSALSASDSADSQTAAMASQTASKISETNSKASETASAGSASAASGSQSAAKTSETNAKASETAASASQSAAKDSETKSSGHATAASEAQNASELARDLARKWATEDEDKPVSGDEFSSLHWAKVAERFASTLTNGMYFAGQWDLADGLPPEPKESQVPWYRVVNNDVSAVSLASDELNNIAKQANKGDQLIWDPIASEWFLIDTSDTVWAVNGQIGDVVLTASDVGAADPEQENIFKKNQFQRDRTVYNSTDSDGDWYINASQGYFRIAKCQRDGTYISNALLIPLDDPKALTIEGQRLFHKGYKPTWSDVDSKPTTFPPSTHTHSDYVVTTRTVNGKPLSDDVSLSAGDVGARASSWVPAWNDVTSKPSQATRWPTWSEVTSKPDTFPPASHSHSWESVTSKPSTFPPSSHTHDYVVTTRTVNNKPLSADVTLSAGDVGAGTRLSGGIDRSNYARLVVCSTGGERGDAGVSFILSGTGDYGSPSRGTYMVEAFVRSSTVRVVVTQLSTATAIQGEVSFYYRRTNDKTDFEVWVKSSPYNKPFSINVLAVQSASVVYDSHTATAPSDLEDVPITRFYHASNKPSAADIGARSSTWLPKYDEVTDKPSTFPPSTHTHAYLPLAGGTLDGNLISRGKGGGDLNDLGTGVISISVTSSAGSNTAMTYNNVLQWGNASNRKAQLVANYDSADNRLFFRKMHDSSLSWKSWCEVYTTHKKPSAADVGARSSSWVPTWSDVTSKPSTFPPSTHTHDTYALKEHNHDSVYAKLSHNHDSAYAKLSHTHSRSVTNSQSLGTTDLNTLFGASHAGVYHQTANSNTTGKNYPVAQAGSLLVLNAAGTVQVYRKYNSSDTYTRSKYRSEDSWTTWRRAYDTAYKPSAADVGARSTSWVPAWNDVTSKPSQATRWPTWSEVTSKPTTFAPSSHSHSWDSVTSKPSTFPPSSHEHAWSQVTGKPTTFPPATHSHSELETKIIKIIDRSDSTSQSEPPTLNNYEVDLSKYTDFEFDGTWEMLIQVFTYGLETTISRIPLFNMSISPTSSAHTIIIPTSSNSTFRLRRSHDKKIKLHNYTGSHYALLKVWLIKGSHTKLS